MRKTIDKAFERIKEGDHIEINMSTSPLHFSLGYGPSYEICIQNSEGWKSLRSRIDIRKGKIGYGINRFLDIPGKDFYQRIGFSFTKDKAKKKAHNYALKTAQEVSVKQGLRLVDRSQEDIVNIKKRLEEKV